MALRQVILVNCQKRRDCQTLPLSGTPVPAIFGNLGNFGNCIFVHSVWTVNNFSAAK